MFQPGDVVSRGGDHPNMTVEKVEKCLDCKGLVVSCVWADGFNALRSEFNAKALTLIQAARPAPRPVTYAQIFTRVQEQAQWIVDPPHDPERDPF